MIKRQESSEEMMILFILILKLNDGIDIVASLLGWSYVLEYWLVLNESKWFNSLRRVQHKRSEEWARKQAVVHLSLSLHPLLLGLSL